jgi:predicted acyl esterase
MGAVADETAAIPDTDRVNMQWSIKIPLRDGVHLSATVYTPRDQKSPAPYIFTLTPYIAQSYHDRGIYFASHGYPFLTVDVRGRTTFQSWLAHAHLDEYWDSYNPTAEQYAKLSIPILTITGSYDGDQPGALAHYQEYMKNSSSADWSVRAVHSLHFRMQGEMPALTVSA